MCEFEGDIDSYKVNRQRRKLQEQKNNDIVYNRDVDIIIKRRSK